MAVAPAPSQMFVNRLDARKGWPAPYALDYRLKISPTVLYSVVPGQVGHIATDGTWVPGVIAQEMALFLFSGSTELDVNSVGGTAGGVTQWIPISPTGQNVALVGKGQYELTTTEFDNTQVYNPGTICIAPGGVAANSYPGSGQLTSAGFTFGTNAYCAIVTSKYKNNYGMNVLAFWPVYAPTAAA